MWSGVTTSISRSTAGTVGAEPIAPHLERARNALTAIIGVFPHGRLALNQLYMISGQNQVTWIEFPNSETQAIEPV